MRNKYKNSGPRGILARAIIARGALWRAILVGYDGGMFVIEDERHAEPQGQFASLDLAMAELKQRATMPWDQFPNLAPCTNWRSCGRTYEVVEYDDSQLPWKELKRIAVLEVSAAGAKWAGDFEKRVD